MPTRKSLHDALHDYCESSYTDDELARNLSAFKKALSNVTAKELLSVDSEQYSPIANMLTLPFSENVGYDDRQAALVCKEGLNALFGAYHHAIKKGSVTKPEYAAVLLNSDPDGLIHEAAKSGSLEI